MECKKNFDRVQEETPLFIFVFCLIYVLGPLHGLNNLSLCYLHSPVSYLVPFGVD